MLWKWSKNRYFRKSFGFFDEGLINEYSIPIDNSNWEDEIMALDDVCIAAVGYSTTFELYSFGPKMGPPAFLSPMSPTLKPLDTMRDNFPTVTPYKAPSILKLDLIKTDYPTPVSYTPPSMVPKKLAIESPGSILRTRYDLENGYGLQERLDFSGHDNTAPHLNYEIISPLKSKPLKSLLGDVHIIDLD